MDIQQLMRKLQALQFGMPETETTQPKAIEPNKPEEQVESELLCFMTEISLDPGLPKTL